MIKEVVELQLKEVEKRLAKQNLHLEITNSVKEYLSSAGYDEVYGARPLKRLINEQIVDEIALQIIEGKIKPLDKVVVDYKQSKILITVKKPS